MNRRTLYLLGLLGGALFLFEVRRRSSGLSWPVVGARISSAFGMRRHPTSDEMRAHEGVDLAAAEGTPVVAAGDGKIVRRVAMHETAGNYLWILHPDGLTTRYLHMQAFAPGIATGSEVRRGDLIGYVGQTGNVTGPHTHFEVRLSSGQAVDPMTVVA